jgi:hypothetical protein
MLLTLQVKLPVIVFGLPVALIDVIHNFAQLRIGEHWLKVTFVVITGIKPQPPFGGFAEST